MVKRLLHKKSVTLAFLALLTLAAQMAWAGVPGFMLARMGEISGTVELPEKKIPKDGVILAFFNQETGPPPVESGMRRVPDMLDRSDSEGRFSVKLLPGKYFVGMLIRETGEGPGPPRPGEKFYFALDAANKLRLFEVPEKQQIKVGVVRGMVPESVQDFKEFLTVEGRVTDEQGKPLVGAYVLIKTTPNAARPLFISMPTDKDGKYRIKVPPDTIYYVVVRDQIQGGRPLPGSYIGTYGKTAPAQGDDGAMGGGAAGAVGSGGEGEALPVSGGKGQVRSNVDVTVFRLPDPEENRKKFQKSFPDVPPGQEVQQKAGPTGKQ